MTEPPNIPNLNSLVELGRRDGVDIRPTLLRVMTDLYVQAPAHTADEERHFTELALRLIELVDAATLSGIADRIASYPNAPAAVRRRLLRENIVLGPPGHCEPSAGIGLDPQRPEYLSGLFFAASAEERRLILLNLPYAPIEPADPPSETAARNAVGRLETAALGHNSAAFVRELEQALRISRDRARQVADDPSGEPVVVAAVVLGMPAAVLQRILLCLNPSVSRSVQRVYDLAVLHEEIDRNSALRLLAVWQTSDRQETAPKAADRAPAPAKRPQRAADPGIRALPPARPQIDWEVHARARPGDNG